MYASRGPWHGGGGTIQVQWFTRNLLAFRHQELDITFKLFFLDWLRALDISTLGPLTKRLA